MKDLQIEQIPASVRKLLPASLEKTAESLFCCHGDRWLLDDYWLTKYASAKQLKAEVESLKILQGTSIPTANTAEIVETEGLWLLQTALAGAPAHLVSEHRSIELVAREIGAAIKVLHEQQPPAELRTLDWLWFSKEVENRLVAPSFDITTLPAPYGSCTAQELSDNFFAGAVKTSDPVVSHGGLGVKNFWIGSERLSGVTNWSALAVRDRYFDLAFLHLSIHKELGPEAVFVFYEAYGRDPDLVKLDHYLMATHILA